MDVPVSETRVEINKWIKQINRSISATNPAVRGTSQVAVISLVYSLSTPLNTQQEVIINRMK